jgi:uncharacterized protein (DUF3084 family)
VTVEAELLALRCEAEGLRAELDRTRVENTAMRAGHIEARRHIALALRALTSEHQPDPLPASTDRFHNGG